MKYKILLTGNNKTIIDDLFTKSSDRFEYQSTSSRYEDILCHLRHFKPDGFLYCINHELPESFRKMSDLKKTPEAGSTGFFAIGTRADCDAYTRTAPGVVDLVMEKPMSITVMEEQMSNYFINLTTHQILPTMPPVSPSPSTINPAPQGQPQAGSPAMNPGQANVQPQAAAPMQTNAQPQAAAPMQTAAQPQTANPVQPNVPKQAANPATQQPIQQTAAQSPASNEKPAEPAAKPDSAKPASGMPNFSEDPNDALLLALTEHVDETAKMIDAMGNLPSMNSDSEEDPNRRKHILVVDDDSRMLKIIKRHLAEKYDVATALNGRLALKFLETKKTDLILLDYEMPLENGPVILKKLKDNPFTREIPVIFLTGISDREKIEKALVLKPQGYLLKPIDHIKLLSTISKLIG